MQMCPQCLTHSESIHSDHKDFLFDSGFLWILSMEVMDNMHVCVTQCWDVCMCVASLSLSRSTRPLCHHALQRAPSCHSWQHTARKNVTKRGRWETKTQTYGGKMSSGEGLKPWVGIDHLFVRFHSSCSTTLTTLQGKCCNNQTKFNRKQKSAPFKAKRAT